MYDLFGHREYVYIFGEGYGFVAMTCPTPLLLKREEIETKKVEGHSIIAGIHHGKGIAERMYVQAPMD